MLDWFGNLPTDRKIWNSFVAGATLIALLMYCLGALSILFRSSLGGLTPPQFTPLPTLTPLGQLPLDSAAPADIPLASATALIPTPSETAAPSLTTILVRSPSPILDATRTLIPSSTPKPSRTVAAVTRPPTAATSYSVAVLREPAPGTIYTSGDTIVLRWIWERTLNDDEWFDIQLWREGAQPRGIAWVKETTHELTPGQVPVGEYFWRIVVLKHTETATDGTKVWELLSEPSAVWRFTVE